MNITEIKPFQPTSLLHQQHHQQGVEYFKKGEYGKACKEFHTGVCLVRDYLIDKHCSISRDAPKISSPHEKYKKVFTGLFEELIRTGGENGYRTTLNSKGISLMKMKEYVLASDVYKTSMSLATNARVVERSLESYILSDDLLTANNLLYVAAMLAPDALSNPNVINFSIRFDEVSEKIEKMGIDVREGMANLLQNNFDMKLFNQVVMEEIFQDKYSTIEEEEMIRKITNQADECNHVELKSIGNGKYSLFVTSDIQKGETIIVEQPFVTGSVSPQNHCSNCANSLKNFEPICCPSCQHEKYCSAQCREEAWKMYHNVNCGYYPDELIHKVKEDGLERNAACLTGYKLIAPFIKLLIPLNETFNEEAQFNSQFFMMLSSGFFRKVCEYDFDNIYTPMMRGANLFSRVFNSGFYSKLCNSSFVCKDGEVTFVPKLIAFTKHGKDPNAELEFNTERSELEDNKPSKCILKAKRTICKGQEIFIDFREWKRPCECVKETYGTIGVKCDCDTCFHNKNQSINNI